MTHLLMPVNAVGKLTKNCKQNLSTIEVLTRSSEGLILRMLTSSNSGA